MRARHRASGVFSTIATAGQSCSLARFTRDFRASGWTLVASMTVRRPARRRVAAMNSSTAKASGVAAWSVASSATIALQASEETTSVGLKWREAKYDFPEPEGPMSVTRHSSGIVIFIA